MQEVQRPIFDDDPALMQFRGEKRNSERTEPSSEVNIHYEWLRRHPDEYLSWIKANFGSVAAFERQIVPKKEDFTGKDLPEDVAARRKKLQLLDQNIAKRKRK